MLYLLDTNVLIDAQHKFYPIDRIPEFWAWLVSCGKQQQMKIPVEIYEEILPGQKQDPLRSWLQKNKAILYLKESVNNILVQEVMDKYAPDLTDEEIETCGRDPFLIAYALCDSKDRIVVTNEISRPNRKRANRHIPDVCKDLDIQVCNTWQFIEKLDFRTGRFPQKL